MQPLLNIAVRAARAAGSLIMRHLERTDRLEIDEKARNDFVTEVDRWVEEEIIQTIQKAYPDHGILGEESGGKQSGSEYLWIIDPLDGTLNFVHGFPHFAVSIGVQYRGRLESGVVYDPVRQELFTAIRGNGAYANDRRMRVTQRASFSEGGIVLGTGFPFRNHQHIDAYLGMFRSFLLEVADIRRPGSAALDLAYLAAGRLDGFWEIGLKPWDMAAGIILLREAGGMATDFDGGESFMETGNIIAANPKLLQKMLTIVRANHTPQLTR